MSDFRVSCQVRDVTSGNPQITFGFANVSYSPAGTHDDRRTVEVGTSEVEYTLSTDIGDSGFLLVINNGPTNYVQLGWDTGVYKHRLRPGIPYLIPLEPAIASFFMKANTAACEVMFHAFEA